MKKLILALCLALPLATFAQKSNKPITPKELSIVFIGNSITQGALLENPVQDAPPAKCIEMLRDKNIFKDIKFANRGVSGATTVDFIPAMQKYFPRVTQAADEISDNRILLFSIMLGTNDSAVKGPTGAPVLPAQYITNIEVIVNELMRIYPEAIFVLHRPIWYSPNTYNSAIYLKEGLERIESYYPQLQKLVERYKTINPDKVFMGDTEAFDYFRDNTAAFTPENGNAGVFYLHPNKSGAASLSSFWAKGILSALGESK